MTSTAPTTTSTCAKCGLAAKKQCAGCKRYNVQTYYCSKEHQQEHWRTHKAACGAAGAAEPSPTVTAGPGAGAGASAGAASTTAGGGGGGGAAAGAAVQKCTRCLQPFGPGRCTVPHPVNKRQVTGSTYHSGVSDKYFECLACGGECTLTSNCDIGAAATEERVTSGPPHCFDGPHTRAPLDEGDERRIVPNTVHLSSGPNLQRDIDALPDDVVTLVITSGTYGYDSSASHVLARALPRLEYLQLEDVPFSKVHLTEALTPNVKKLSMQNVSDDCDLQVVLPKLREVSVHYFTPVDTQRTPEGWRRSLAIDGMLEAATKLRSFDSYKLNVGCLSFASNSLKSVSLHRSDCLEYLKIWAPNLVTLGLQACYSLESIAFLDVHPMQAQLPPDHQIPELTVDTTNATLGPAAKRALRHHPTAVKAGGPQRRGMPTEAAFAQMFGPGGMLAAGGLLHGMPGMAPGMMTPGEMAARMMGGMPGMGGGPMDDEDEDEEDDEWDGDSDEDDEDGSDFNDGESDDEDDEDDEEEGEWETDDDEDDDEEDSVIEEVD